MKHVPIAKFKDHVSEFIAEAQSGEEIIVTRHGQPTVKLVAIEADKRAKHREAVEGIIEFGRKYREKYGPTSAEQIRQWLEEDRNRL